MTNIVSCFVDSFIRSFVQIRIDDVSFFFLDDDDDDGGGGDGSGEPAIIVIEDLQESDIIRLRRSLSSRNDCWQLARLV